MLNDRELEKAIFKVISRLDEVNAFLIKKVATQIKQIGELGPSNINRIMAMVSMGTDILEINTRLQEATGLNMQDLFAVYQTALNEVYTDKRFEAFIKGDPDGALARQAKQQLTVYAQNVAVQSAKAIQNLSNTTLVADTYRDALDKAVLAVSTGGMDYGAATRAVIRKIGYGGLQVQYPSGYHRRLDTAVRQNVTDAVKQISQQGANLVGEVLGYDAVEITAHMNSAPDHEPVQGRVFLRTEFDKMQSGQPFEDIDGNHYDGFSRPICEWNCKHLALPFSTKYSVRTYNPETLKEWREKNNAGCGIAGTKRTLYEADQLMRKIETNVRHWKDAANAARIAGDEEERRSCQLKINALATQYKNIADAAGLPQRKARMSVDGFKMVKV